MRQRLELRCSELVAQDEVRTSSAEMPHRSVDHKHGIFYSQKMRSDQALQSADLRDQLNQALVRVRAPPSRWDLDLFDVAVRCCRRSWRRPEKQSSTCSSLSFNPALTWHRSRDSSRRVSQSRPFISLHLRVLYFLVLVMLQVKQNKDL